MKTIICSIFIFAEFGFSCNVMETSSYEYPATEVNLFEENRINLEQVRLQVHENKLHKNENLFLAYQARLDSSVFVYLTHRQIKLFKMCETSKECDELHESFDFSRIFSDELNQLKTAKAFENKFDIDSLAKHILNIMKLASYNHFSLSSISYNREFSDNVKQDRDFAEEALTSRMFCNGFCDYMDTLRQCPELATASISLFKSHHRQSITDLQNNMYLVNGLQNNAAFKIYDLNGNLIRQGFLRNGIIRTKGMPVILIVSNASFLLK